jgi:glutamate synthase (NADPH) small chain
MGKATGFLEFNRKSNYDVPAEERLTTFREFHRPISEEERREQGARCMNCGVPLCQSAMKLSGMVTGCPLHNLIPEWNDQVYQGHYEHAFSRLIKTSNFPEFTGRVCPALCEKACINGEYGEPVTIHDNELFVIETAYANGYLQPRIPKVRSGKKVAVIGAGPSGLAAADELNHRGHLVTVFEREDRIGGLLMYGIPNMKLDKSVIYRRQRLMEAEGVQFRTGVNVGVDITAKELLDAYDAVVLTCGAKQARGLKGGDPSEIKGIYYAVDFLTSTTKSLLNQGFEETAGTWREAESRDVETFMKGKDFISAAGRNVVVVGGGDTGNDCIGTVLRHGCKSVTALEMMPKPPVERTESNPWPEWPKVLKTDYGHEEAIKRFGHDPRVYETTVKEFHTNKKGELKEIVTAKVRFENRQMSLVEGSEKTIPCDLLLIAAGFTGCQPYTAEAFGVKLTQRGVVETAAEDVYATNVPKVFAAGDMHRGQSLVVWAVAEGRRCAHDVDTFLMGYSNMRES